MIIGEIRERFEIENILLTYREYFRRENDQAASFIGENTMTRCPKSVEKLKPGGGK